MYIYIGILKSDSNNISECINTWKLKFIIQNCFMMRNLKSILTRYYTMDMNLQKEINYRVVKLVT